MPRNTGEYLTYSTRQQCRQVRGKLVGSEERL